MSPDRVIGRDNRIPWRRPADLKRFKQLTLGGTLIMGRLTFESIGRPLPGRRNLVVASARNLTGVEVFASLAQALAACRGPVWIIGGASLFAEALTGPADFVDLTHIPDTVPVEDSVLFPRLDPESWVAGPLKPNSEDPQLWHQRFYRPPRLTPRGVRLFLGQAGWPWRTGRSA